MIIRDPYSKYKNNLYTRKKFIHKLLFFQGKKYLYSSFARIKCIYLNTDHLGQLYIQPRDHLDHRLLPFRFTPKAQVIEGNRYVFSHFPKCLTPFPMEQPITCLTPCLLGWVIYNLEFLYIYIHTHITTPPMGVR